MAELRLQVHLSRAGVMSRRRAEAAIEEGRVAVNGEVVTQQGVKVDPDTDRVELDGEAVGRPQHPATIMLHKPDGVLTTLEDPRGRETVAQLVDEPFRFVPVGRLDFHTEGLLLLSTDGTLVHRLLHPSYHVPKGYRVKVAGAVSEATLDRLREGIELEDGPTRPALVEILERTPRTSWLEIVVSEGRNHLVRRMVDAVGHAPRRVVRLEFGTLALDDLKPGQYRYLSPSEVDALYRTTQLPGKSQPPRFQEVGTRPLGTARRGRGKIPGAAGASLRTESERRTRPSVSTSNPDAPSRAAAAKTPGRKRKLTKGRAVPPEAPPVDDELLGVGKKPAPGPRLRPDGVPTGRPSSYPDTRVWRKVAQRQAEGPAFETPKEERAGQWDEGPPRPRREAPRRGPPRPSSDEGRDSPPRGRGRPRDESSRSPGPRSRQDRGEGPSPRRGRPRRGSGRPRGGGRPGGRGSR